MNQGKIIVGIAVLLGISAGLAGYWWNYRVGHRALNFYGADASRLIRLAPKVEYLQQLTAEDPTQAPRWQVTADLSQARGLIHLRNALLSDDQYQWDSSTSRALNEQFALRFSEGDKSCTLYFDRANKAVRTDQQQSQNILILGPLAKSLEQFLAREMPRAEQDAAKPEVDQKSPAKSE